MLAAGIVMDIISTLADPSGIDGWVKAGFGLHAAIDHDLGNIRNSRIQSCGTYGDG